jgi:hypothetical protein
MIDPESMTPTERRFWALVDVVRLPDGTPNLIECWPWKGCRTKPSINHHTHPGYGQFRIGNKRVRAHRFAWECWTGETMPAHLDAAHVDCDNPPCCNPTHVEPQTHTENWRSYRERYPKGKYQQESHV